MRVICSRPYTYSTCVHTHFDYILARFTATEHMTGISVGRESHEIHTYSIPPGGGGGGGGGWGGGIFFQVTLVSTKHSLHVQQIRRL